MNEKRHPSLCRASPETLNRPARVNFESCAGGHTLTTCLEVEFILIYLMPVVGAEDPQRLALTIGMLNAVY